MIRTGARRIGWRWSSRCVLAPCVLTVVGWMMIGAGRPAAAAQLASAIDVPILVTQVPSSVQSPVVPGALMSSPLTFAGEGGRIIAMAPDGVPRVLTEGFHSAADPSISFDATRFVFAGKRAATDLWNVYEYSFESGQMRQVTHDVGNCRQPLYQSSLFTLDSPGPWFQVTFVSDAAAVLNEDSAGLAHSLYSCKLDGSEVRRLSFNLSDDVDPFLMGDGRMVYASWQRSTLERGLRGRVALFGINIDGTDCALFADPAGKRMKRMPCITDRGLVLFVEADELAADGTGQLGMVTFRRPLNSYGAITAESAGFAYRSPAPWSQGQVLLARRPLDRSATLGIYTFDPKMMTAQAVFDDPLYDEIQAVAVRAIRQPDGRSTVVDDAEPLARMYCLNIATTDFADASWMPAGTVKRIRVLEGIPVPVAERDALPFAGSPSTTSFCGATRNGLPLVQRRLLGEAEIAVDGSFHVAIPANLPIQLQALDEDGLALRSCGWIWSKNSEPRGCIGCHEDGERTPKNAFADALARPAIALTLPAERRRTVDFRRDVMPILEQKCVACHGPEGSPPRLDGGLTALGQETGDFNRAYVNLLAVRDASHAQPMERQYVHPGRARTSPLMWHLFGRNTSRPWDGDSARQSIKPIPPGQTPPLTGLEQKTFAEWVDMGAMWDGIPGPDKFSSGPRAGE
ncbi:MAG: HzsA-related protein [Pirellulaceae bacterium]